MLRSAHFAVTEGRGPLLRLSAEPSSVHRIIIIIKASEEQISRFDAHSVQCILLVAPVRVH